MAFGTIFGDSTFDIDLETKSAVNELERVLKKCSDLKLGTAATDAVVQKFMVSFGQLANSANYCAKPLETIVKNAEKLRDALKGNGVLSNAVAKQLKDSVQAQTLNYMTNRSPLNDLRRMDLLHKAGFDDNEDKDGGGSRRMPKWQAAVKAIATLKVVTRQIVSMATELAKVNREVLLLATNTQLAARDIAAMGGALEAFGGTKGAAANFAKGFEVERAKMQVGQGAGGKFVEAARLWGVEWHPEDFEEQERAIVRRLSDPNLTRTQRIGIQNTLGLDAAQMRRYSQGLDAFEKENARQKEFTKNTEAMTKASDEFLRSQQHLKAAWADMKNGVMAPLLGAMAPLQEKLADLATWMRDNPVGMFLGVCVTGGVKLLEIGRQLLPMFAMMRVMGWAKAGGSAVSSAASSSVATAAKTAGSGAALGPVGAVVGLIAGIVGAAAGVAEAVIAGMTLSQIKDIRRLLTKWRDAWEAANGKGEEAAPEDAALLAGATFIPSAVVAALGNAVIFSLQLKEMRAISDNTSQLVQFTRQRAARGTDAANAENSAQVTIEQISINVQSDSANPTDVAQAVHDHLLREMRAVVIGLDPGGKA